MPSELQLDLLAVPAPAVAKPAAVAPRPRWKRPRVSTARVAQVEALLRGRGWIKRSDLGIDERELRLIKEASNGALLAFPGSFGYRLFDEAAETEWDHADAAITSQINAMIRCRTAYRRRRQRVERSRNIADDRRA